MYRAQRRMRLMVLVGISLGFSLATLGSPLPIPSVVPIKGAIEIRIPAEGVTEASFMILDYNSGEVLLKKTLELDKQNEEFYFSPIHVLRECDEPPGQSYIRAEVGSTFLVLIQKGLQYAVYPVTVTESQSVAAPVVELLVNGSEVQTVSSGMTLTVRVTDSGQDITCEPEKVDLQLKLGSEQWNVPLTETGNATGIFKTQLQISCSPDPDTAALTIKIGGKSLPPAHELETFVLEATYENGTGTVNKNVTLWVENLSDLLPPGESINPECIPQPDFSPYEVISYRKVITSESVEISYVLRHGNRWGFAHKAYNPIESELWVLDPSTEEPLAKLNPADDPTKLEWPMPEYVLQIHTWLVEPTLIAWAGIVGGNRSVEITLNKTETLDEEGRNIYETTFNPDALFPDEDLNGKKLYVSWTNPDCPMEDFDIFLEAKQ